MTMDDECSVYVGGVPYNCSEDSLRQVFNLYGTIVDVKIINDRATQGKCYAFVTFTNPQSAIAAMNDMDGKTINGRIVRVNEVKTRGGRLNVSRDNFRHNVDRGRGRDRQRDFDNHERDRFSGKYNERSRERNRSLDRDVGRAEEYGRDYDREEDHVVGKDQDLEDNERDGSRNHRLDSDGDREMNRNDDYGGVEVQPTRKRNSLSDDHHSRDFSSDSGYDSYDEINEQLEISIQKRDELKEEIAGMEKSLDERKHTVLDLQKKSKKLEDSLKSSKKHTSQRKMQLTKLHKLYVQVRDYTEKLKSYEQELQSLVDSAYKESDYGDDIGVRN